jgi:hypothetical protein
MDYKRVEVRSGHYNVHSGKTSGDAALAPRERQSISVTSRSNVSAVSKLESANRQLRGDVPARSVTSVPDKGASKR